MRHAGKYTIHPITKKEADPRSQGAEGYLYMARLTPDKNTVWATSSPAQKSEQIAVLKKGYLLRAEPATFRYRAAGVDMGIGVYLDPNIDFQNVEDVYRYPHSDEGKFGLIPLDFKPLKMTELPRKP